MHNLKHYCLALCIIWLVLSLTAFPLPSCRASLWSSCVVLPLLALTWMSAVLAITDRRSALFQILFAVFDSLEGFVIVMVHCILRREVPHMTTDFISSQRCGPESLCLGLNATLLRWLHVTEKKWLETWLEPWLKQLFFVHFVFDLMPWIVIQIIGGNRKSHLHPKNLNLYITEIFYKQARQTDMVGIYQSAML